MRCLLFLVVITFFTHASYGSPIAISCGDNNKLEEIIYPPSLLQEQDEFVSMIQASTEAGSCIDCIKNCSDSINKSSAGAIIGAALSSESAIASQSNKKGFSSISDQKFDGLKNLQSIYQSDFNCSHAKQPAQNYIYNGNLALYYPRHTNYMYLTGCSSVNAKKCLPATAKATERSINEAVLMGVDPYVVLAKGFMENGTSGASALYLDPVGTMDVLGCRGRQLKNTEASDSKLDSFGTVFEFKEQVVSNSRLAGQLQKMMDYKSVAYSSEPSYLCRDVVSAGASMSKIPLKNSCCLKLPFSGSQKEMEAPIAKALTYAYAGKQLKNKFRGKSDPAFNIQRFNGYTKLMGGAESVPVYRSGLNFYEDPSYGYQSMDYILTSLASNPFIRGAVLAAELKYGNYESLICKNFGKGKFEIDSDYYFNKHAASKRFNTLKEKVLKGEQLTERERKVLDLEIKSPEVSEALYGDGDAFLGDRENLRNTLLNKYGIQLADSYESESEYFKRLGVSEIMKNDEVFSSKLTKEYNRLKDLEVKSERMNTEMFAVLGKIGIYGKDLSNILSKYDSGVASGSLGFSEADEGDFVSKFLSLIEQSYSKASSVDKRELGRIRNDLVDVKDKIQANQKLYEDIDSQALNVEKLLVSKGKDSEGLDFDVYMSSFSSFDERISASGLTESQLKNPKIKKILDRMRSPVPEINTETYKRYFSEVHSKRDTVRKVSDYTWKRLTNAEKKKIATKLKAYGQ